MTNEIASQGSGAETARRCLVCGAALPDAAHPEATWNGARFLACPSVEPGVMWYVDPRYLRRPIMWASEPSAMFQDDAENIGGVDDARARVALNAREKAALVGRAAAPERSEAI